MFEPSPSLVVLIALAASAAVAQPQDSQSANERNAAASAPGAPLPAPEPPPKSLAIWLGRVESDNLGRTPSEIDGSYDSLGLLLALGHTSTRFAASINGDLERRRYSPEEIDSETVGTLSAEAEVALVADRFSWTFSDYYGQGITDPFSGVGPNNRQQINVITSGPKIVLPAGRRTSVEISGTYSERRFDESSDVDSDSNFYELGLYRQASPTARLGIVASSNDVEYVDVLAPEYRIERVGLRYEKELSTGRVLADLGTNEVTTAGADSDEPRFSLVWTRSLTARSELGIRAAREFSDSSGVLEAVLAPGLEGASFTDVVVSPNPLEQERFGVSYVLTLSRTVASVELDSRRDEYLGNAAFDNDSTVTRLSLVRTVSPELSFGVVHEKVRRDFSTGEAAQSDDEDAWTGAWVNRAFGRRFNLGFSISRYDRKGLQSYDERRYELRVGYSPTASGSSAMGLAGR